MNQNSSQVSHLRDALFEFNCSGEIPLDLDMLSEGGVGDPAEQSGTSSDDSTAATAAALAHSYPTAFPRVLPSGCAFEASLDGAPFEPVPDAVSLTNLANGEHRFSVRYVECKSRQATYVYFHLCFNAIPACSLSREPPLAVCIGNCSVRRG